MVVTQTIHRYGFTERLEFSEQQLGEAGIRAVLKSRIPGCVDVKRASQRYDKQGTDYWAIRGAGLPSLSIDAKVRTPDYLQIKGRDDLALETWSVIEAGKVGWTRDPAKRTDYILWYWPDTRRMVLVPFPALCAVFAIKWREWAETYKDDVHDQETHEWGRVWHSQCVFVPRRVVFDSINGWQTGIVPQELIDAELG